MRPKDFSPEQIESIKFLYDLKSWPLIPSTDVRTCHVKRWSQGGGMMGLPDQFGRIYADDPLTVYRILTPALTRLLTRQGIKDLERSYKYGSVEAMVADGWLVD